MESEREEAIERFAQFTMTQPDGAAKTIIKGIKKTRRVFSSDRTRILSIGSERIFPTHYLTIMPFLRIGEDRNAKKGYSAEPQIVLDRMMPFLERN